MIRFISYLIFTVFSISVSLAQMNSEEILINNYAIQLPGTLTYSQEKSALIIWVHGSGAVDRNGNQAQYIKQFRKAVNQENIAFFSFDKRTANPKNSNIIQQDGIIFNDFVSDIKEVVNHFKNDNRFTEIILAGHSQGSLIAMLALENVDKYISIAGAGETIDKTLVKQISKQSPIYGALTEKYLKELKETGKIKEIDPNLMSLFAPQNQPFLSSWITLKPTEEIKKITIPTLIVNGDKDFQVLVTDAENLKAAKPDAKIVIIKNMNHILKDIQKNEDNLASYTNPNFTISEQLIKTIVEFVKK
ncbi:alpha/beta hydrolase [Polaribacter sp. Asnod6-C07]|uniref:alpha/beta hydrolase n=1 Tax=Polaribacter sp. Asnod6-C07 TaxID=3160582 RepID=UPI00386A5264